MSTVGSPDRPPMLGSQHIFSQGYGYGARVPTSRNVPTLPASVPKYRYPAESPRFTAGTKSTTLIAKNDHRAIVRNADAIHFQTSGEVGSFLIDEPPAVKLNRRGKMPKANPHTIRSDGRSFVNYPQFEASPRPEHNLEIQAANLVKPKFSGRAVDSARGPMSALSTARSELSRTSINNNEAPSTGRGTVSNEVYLSNLKSLDGSFNNRNRRDLLSATKPSRSDRELSLSAANNFHQTEHSKHWSNKLRRNQN